MRRRQSLAANGSLQARYPSKSAARPNQLLALLTSRSAHLLLITVITISYCLVPLLIYGFVIENDLYLRLATLAMITAICIYLGSQFKLLDGLILSRRSKLIVSSSHYVTFFFFFFLLFVVLTISTAPSVPLLSAFHGADADALSTERGGFLKAREGGWVALAYVSSVLTSTLIPYCIVVAYATRSRLRHLFLGLLLFYTVSFLVKALFLNLVLPLVAYGIERGSIRNRQFLLMMGLSVASLIGLISLSGFGSSEGTGFYSLSEYLSTTYVPGSPLDFLIYRSFSVPIFSVVDTLFVHQAELGGELLWGTSSSLIAAIGGVERINIERMVFAHQYGGWNDIGNSNVVFIADGYMNFGVLGVIAYGTFIGLMFRLMRLSKDVGIRCLALLFAFLLYSSPLLGMLLSNGFALIFLQALFLRRRERLAESSTESAHSPWSGPAKPA